MDVSALSQNVLWMVRIIVAIIAFVAGSLAVKKKSNSILIVIVVMFVIFIFLSPIISLITSIVCMIILPSKKNASGEKQDLKSSTSSSEKKKTMVKPGNIIGLLIGIGLVIAPVISYVNQEASLADPTNQLFMLGAVIFGILIIIGNIITLSKKETALPPVHSTIATVPSVHKVETKSEARDEDSNGKIRCRFCKKLYSAEYNGCPHCKKK